MRQRLLATDTALSSYVPYVVARSFAGDPAPVTTPSVDHFPAAVLLADISGFTPLAERLAERGPAGAEELTALLNTYFGQLVDLITEHGGDVFKFAGDALIAVWPAISESLSTVTHRAAQCALAAQSSLHGLEVADGVRLTLRMGVGAGDVLLLVVGGVQGRWEVLVAGQPFPAASAAQNAAQPGEVVLNRSAWELVRSDCQGRAMPDGNFRLDTLLKPERLHPAEIAPLQDEAESALRAFIPDAILSRLAAGQTAWLAELRRVSVLFLSIKGIEYDSPGALDTVQDLLANMQEALGHYRGTIRQFLVDDKGTVLIAAFGLPPRAQEDDAVRAVQAGQMMQASLTRLGLHGAIGITTGRAFCGPVGNALRREYAMVGDVVNLSARLMEAASDSIYCDETTYEAARGRVAFDALPPINVKGKAEPIAVYRPRGQARLPVRTQPIVGRIAEREALLRGVQGLARGNGGGVFIIEGEAGIGKSRLVDEVRRWAEALNLRAWVGAGDASEQEIPYHAWRPILSKLFRLDSIADVTTRGERVQSLLETNPDLTQAAPLLNEIMQLDVPENEITLSLTAAGRAAGLHELLVRLLLGSAARSPTVLILDDAQALDPASWALALALILRQVPNTRAPLLVIATRPLPDPPGEYSQLLRYPATRRLQLAPLPAPETLLLVCRRLGVGALPEQVAALILERARGNPFFSEELAYALRDNGLITITGGECRVAPGVGDLRTVALPDTVQRAIISRIDLLQPRLQLTLKIASVIGRIFTLRALREIHPIPADKERLPADLVMLQRLDLTALHMPEPELTYMFKDEVTREVAYNLLLFSQRRELHRAVAEWYERAYADDLEGHYGLLAHHWNKAEEPEKALYYLEKASSSALRRYANAEAADYLRRALELDAASPTPSPPLRRATWASNLGESYYRLGRMAESSTQFEHALELLKQPIPRSEGRKRSGELAGMLGQAFRQALSRARKAQGQVQQSDGEPDPARIEAIGAYERLAQIHYLNHEIMGGLHAALRALNLAETVQQPAELARAYATAAVAVGIMGLHAVAEDYVLAARRIAEPLGHLATLAYVLEMVGTYWTGIGRWDSAREALSRAVEIADRTGDERRWVESLAVLADVAYFEGRFEESAGLRDQIYAAAQNSGTIQGQLWGLVGLVPSLLALDRITDEALALVEAMSAEETAPLEAYGNLAAALLYRGEPARARQSAESAAHLIANSRPTAHFSLTAYAGVAEVFLALLAMKPSTAREDRDELERQARQACDDMAAFARVFPIARPRTLLYEGLLLWLTGHKMRATMSWKRCIAEARKLHMPYDEALAYHEMARHLPQSDPRRQEQMTRAFNLFSKLGAEYDLARMQSAS